MRRRTAGLAIAGLIFGAAAVQAETALMFMSPKNLKEVGFTLTSKAGKDKSVEYVVRREIKGIDGPGRAGYLSKDGDKSIGTPVKLRAHGTMLEFRFSVPEDQLATTQFTLWGQGARGEGVTFRFALKDFRPVKSE